MNTIAVDAMGGDHGAQVIVPACVESLKEGLPVQYILVGDQVVLRRILSGLGCKEGARIQIHHASEQVAMDEAPSVALRTKKDSSMRVAINLVHQAKAQACVSAGNTGALMATARFVLKTVEGIARPAILSRLPNQQGGLTRVLDLGANVNASVDNLVGFAIMGSILAHAVGGIARPRVGLLNIGEEEHKGDDLLKQASECLAQMEFFDYAGYVEGNDWFSGKVDVVVCDGFVGNVALKAVEGVVRFLMDRLVSGFNRNLFTRIIGLLAKPVLKHVHAHSDPRAYNGASLVGLNGIVVKSHGSADVAAFKNALQEAHLEISKDVPAMIRQRYREVINK